jgi:hypothetical protein
MSTASKADTFTFRLDPALKSALRRAAKEERLPPAELLRLLVREHLARRARHAFEAEARRQSLLVAGGAADPAGDEAQVMREIEAGLDRDDFADAWKP